MEAGDSQNGKNVLLTRRFIYLGTLGLIGDKVDEKNIALVVDLDGTLLKTDSLWETFFRFAARKPWLLCLVPLYLLKGIPYLKERLSIHGGGDSHYWPFNADVIALIEIARAQKRHICLATAAHETIAEAVSVHFGCFDSIIATTGSINRKGWNKLAAMIEKFGPGKFDYVGDSPSDLPIWAASREAILVGKPESGLARKAESVNKNLHVVKIKRPTIFTYVKAIRVYQWSKNSLLFVPLILSHSFDWRSIGNCILAAFAFSFLASAIYVLNDMTDLSSDRRHPRKRNRPFASGILPLWQGPLLLLPGLILGTIALSYLLPLKFIYTAVLYLLMNLLYTYWLKREILLDVVTLAILYVLRIIAGSMVMEISTSNWLLGFAFFVFLGLALIKRFSELGIYKEDKRNFLPGRSYIATDKNILESMAVASGFGSMVIFALYIDSLKAAKLYSHPTLLWLLCPLIVYWYSRLLLLAQRSLIKDDPVSFVLKDKTSWYCILIGVIITVVSA